MTALEFNIKDNSDEVLNKLKQQKQVALEAIGLKAEGYAKLKAPTASGTLKNSLTHEVREDTVYIGTDEFYAKYVELGTGIYYPSGRKGGWRYKDEKGKWHFTYGIKPHHFLQSAVQHEREYKEIAKHYLSL